DGKTKRNKALGKKFETALVLRRNGLAGNQLTRKRKRGRMIGHAVLAGCRRDRPASPDDAQPVMITLLASVTKSHPNSCDFNAENPRADGSARALFHRPDG